jgi:valyl-tRNA synthetase
MQKLDETNFLIFAAKHYENTYYDTTEFYDDLKRFVYLKRLFNQHENKKELKVHLILNHIIILYNVFGPYTTEMLFLKLEGHETLLKTFLVYLQRMPDRISNLGIKNRIINNKDIKINAEVMKELEAL